jgi:group II intron reverse transcriptase/maturase
LRFVFADNPKGDGGAETSDVSDGKAWLSFTAKRKTTKGPATDKAAKDGLMEQIASLDNLAVALQNVARNKGAPGVDGQSVEEVVAAAKRLTPRLRHTLLDGSYRPGEIRRVWIPKPGGGQRGLGIPNVVDRWVQEAIRRMLEPIFEPHFHPSSHGFRPGRSAATAIAEAKAHVEAGYEWVVDLDLAKFFDQVNHQRLLARLGRRVADPRVLSLVNRMLKAQVVLPDGVRIPTEKGTPQGGPLSPLLSNVVLDELDWELDRRGLRFVRYADDCNIFVGSERSGRRVMDSTRRFLERKLRLAINEQKSAVSRPQYRHFLGFRLRPCGEGRVEVGLSKRTRQRLDTKIRELTPRRWGQPLAALFEAANRYLRGWMGYFRICTEGTTYFKRCDAHIRRRIRAVVIHQKKRPRYLYRHLRQCGVNPRAAGGTAFRSRGIWKRSSLPGISLAYRNVWFHERLVSLETAWRAYQPPRAVTGQGDLFAHLRYRSEEPDVWPTSPVL